MPTTLSPTLTPISIPAYGPVYSREQVAEMFGVGTRTVWAWTRRGAMRTAGEWIVLPSVPLGRRVWYRECDVKDFADRMRILEPTRAQPKCEPSVPAARAVPKDVAERLRRRGFIVGGA